MSDCELTNLAGTAEAQETKIEAPTGPVADEGAGQASEHAAPDPAVQPSDETESETKDQAKQAETETTAQEANNQPIAVEAKDQAAPEPTAQATDNQPGSGESNSEDDADLVVPSRKRKHDDVEERSAKCLCVGSEEDSDSDSCEF